MTDTETRLREAMRAATSHSSGPVAFAQIGRRVQARRRRRQAVAGVAALVAVAVATPVWLVPDGDGDRSGEPAQSAEPTTSPTTAPPAPPRDPSELDPAIVHEPWTAKRWGKLPWSDTALPRLLDPVAAGTTSLADDPVQRALAAVQLKDRGPIYLLGEDGRWREQDLVDVERTEEYDSGPGRPLGIGSLSSDGTRLALPQPHGLIVIDLATNEVHRHELPGRLPQQVSWGQDDREVLVYAQRDRSYRYESGLVDAETGAWRKAPYDVRYTSIAEDGTAVEAARQPESAHFGYDLRRYGPDGDRESDPLPIALFTDSKAPVAAGTDAVLVMRHLDGWTLPRAAGSWPGPTVIDIDSAEAVAQLPVRGANVMGYKDSPFGWVDHDTVLLRLNDYAVAWDYRSGELRRVTEVAGTGSGLGSTVSIATALAESGD